MRTRTHERWGSQLGFVLAAIGSAAGLGNLWRFSYVAGENGGAAFLIIYVACVLLLGIPLIIAELAVGRRAHSDAVAAFATSAGGRRWGSVGAVGVMSACLVLSFYMADRQRIPVAALWCATGDTLLAVVVGVAIFSAVFSFGLDPGQGPELAFITLPALFSRMPFGHLIGAVFFGLLITAALTSMVSVLEVPVAYLRRVTGWTRRRVTWATTSVIFLAGVPSALSFGILSDLKLAGLGVLEAVDFTASNLLLPISALMVSLFVGWKLQATQARACADLTSSPLGPVWLGLVRFFAPPAILLVLLQGLAIL